MFIAHQLHILISSKIERGLRSPTIDTLFKIAHAFDIPPHKLIKAIEDEMPQK